MSLVRGPVGKQAELRVRAGTSSAGRRSLDAGQAACSSSDGGRDNSSVAAVREVGSSRAD